MRKQNLKAKIPIVRDELVHTESLWKNCDIPTKIQGEAEARYDQYQGIQPLSIIQMSMSYWPPQTANP